MTNVTMEMIAIHSPVSILVTAARLYCHKTPPEFSLGENEPAKMVPHPLLDFLVEFGMLTVQRDS